MGRSVSGQSAGIVHFIMFAVTFRGLCRSVTKGPGMTFVNETFDIFWNSFENAYPDESYTIKTEGCNIPGMNFLDPSIRTFVQYPSGVTSCPNSESPLIGNNQTHIRVLKENYPHYNITNDKHLNCCYSFLYPYTVKSDEATKSNQHLHFKRSTCISFVEVIEVMHEYVRVSCDYYRDMVYEQFIAFTPKKRFTMERENPFEYPKHQSPYNVIMLGLGSMSRLNFHRTMPNTLNYLNKKGVIELKGYNAVVDSFSNVIPVLSGLDFKDLQNICRPYGHSTFDRCPFIWERFKDAGFYTAFAQDSTKYGILDVNKFSKGGFNHMPTDYYLQPFIQEAEKENNNSTKMCMGNKFYYQVMLDYIGNLTATLKPYRLFGLFWESFMSNSQMNFPMLMDHNYESLIMSLDTSGYLNDTVLILFSDHGVKVGNFLTTTQGLLEERLPFLYILTPPSFRKKYDYGLENLMKNTKRLTTPFDLHSTLIDLIDLTSIQNEELRRRSSTGDEHSKNKGMSLFLQIPGNRTCESAGINNKACTCLKIKRLPLNSMEARIGSSFLIKTVNDLLNPYPQCARLKEGTVIEAIEMSNTHEYAKYVRDFVIIVRTTPGGGLFEAKMRARRRRRRRKTNSWSWELVGPVGRRNLYGAQSFCVKDYSLKMFCYCYASHDSAYP